jgi:hypothetical protein
MNIAWCTLNNRMTMLTSPPYKGRRFVGLVSHRERLWIETSVLGGKVVHYSGEKNYLAYRGTPDAAGAN